MRIFKEMAIVGLAIFAGIYLMFPSFIPDVLPFIGWIDEGFCTLILANTASYYGINLTNIYGKPPSKRIVRRRVKKRPVDHVQRSRQDRGPIIDGDLD